MNSEMESSGFYERIDSLIGEEEPFVWAKKVGIPSATFARMRKEKTVPRWQHLVKIAAYSEVSIDWLLTGGEFGEVPKDKAPAPIVTSVQPVSSSADHLHLDEELNARVVDGISRLYKDLNIGLAPMDLGRLAARMYADVVNTYDDPEERRVGLKAFLAQLRKQLMEPAKNSNPNETKRLA